MTGCGGAGSLFAPTHRGRSLALALATVLVGPAIVASEPADLAESRDAYEIVASTTATLLPGPLGRFFKARREGLTESSVEDLLPVHPPGATAVDAAHHYIALDGGVRDAEADIRHAAIRRFPHTPGAARELFKRHKIRHGGNLPWMVEKRYRALVKAFRAGDPESMVHETGRLVHFVTDASLPFNTTFDRDGVAAGRLVWTAEASTSASRSHRTIRNRCQLGLLSVFRKQFDHEVRVWPGRLVEIDEPLEAVFGLLLAAHNAIEPLLEADSAITTELGITDAGSFVASSDGYYPRLCDRVCSILETRLEEGALLSANLILAAWVEAGRPPLDKEVVVAGHGPQSDRAEPQRAARYVGSRSSTVFHFATCTHARRIKRENLVEFGTLGEARTAGRMPCRSCKPDSP